MKIYISREHTLITDIWLNSNFKLFGSYTALLYDAEIVIVKRSQYYLSLHNETIQFKLVFKSMNQIN